MIIAIEGNIGSGKSTLLDRLVRESAGAFEVLTEPVDEWSPWLHLAYAEPERWSFALNLKVLLTLKRWFAGGRSSSSSSSKVTVCERSSLAGLLVFGPTQVQMGLLDEAEMALFREAHACLDMWLPDAIVYLRTDPGVCYDRIQRRSRDSEKTVSLEYIQSIHARHDEVFLPAESQPGGLPPVVVVDGNEDGDAVYERVRAFIRRGAMLDPSEPPAQPRGHARPF